MAMVSESNGRLSAREGALGMQQKMLRQRQLVLKRQTEAAKSFGVVAQQHAPTVETPRQAPDWAVTELMEAPTAPRSKDPDMVPVGIVRCDEALPPEVTPESPEERSMTMTLELDAEQLGLELIQAEKPETVGQGWNLDVASAAPKGLGKVPRFWTPWRNGEVKTEECSVEAVGPELFGGSPEPTERKYGSAAYGGAGEGVSALNMGRVATPWIGQFQNLALPGELEPEDMVEPVLEETGPDM